MLFNPIGIELPATLRTLDSILVVGGLIHRIIGGAVLLMELQTFILEGSSAELTRHKSFSIILIKRTVVVVGYILKRDRFLRQKLMQSRRSRRQFPLLRFVFFRLLHYKPLSASLKMDRQRLRAVLLAADITHQGFRPYH